MADADGAAAVWWTMMVTLLMDGRSCDFAAAEAVVDIAVHMAADIGGRTVADGRHHNADSVADKIDSDYFHQPCDCPCLDSCHCDYLQKQNIIRIWFG